LRIIIDALGIGKPGGGRSATLNLLNSLFQLDKNHEYILLLNSPEPSLPTGSANVRTILLPINNRFLSRLALQVILPLLARHLKADLVHFSKNLGCFGVPARIVVTVYDLTTLLYPQIYPRIDVWYWRKIEPMILHRADRVVAISQDVSRDLQRVYKLPKSRISVIYPGYDPIFRPLNDRAGLAKVRDKYGLPECYILHVGSISPKKNLETLVLAYYNLCRAIDFPGKLVLVGRMYWEGKAKPLLQMIEDLKLQDEVVFTGVVAQQDLPLVYNGAAFCVFPSLHEGFGIVPLEAMACGVPLIISANAGAVTEVVGEAALAVDTSSGPDQLCEAMRVVFQNTELQRSLSSLGLARAQRFSSLNVARETLALYSELVAG